jgi:mannose-1-phosphate guanylyltransferase
MEAIILAGGAGTRLRPLTDTTPKPLLPIQGRPTLEHAVLNFRSHGIKDIILSVSYKADQIKEYFGDGSQLGVNIGYSVETEPLGTGGAVRQAATGIRDPFLLAWGDNLMDLNISELIETHDRYFAGITMTLTQREDVENFGVAKLEGNLIKYFVEKPKREAAPSNWINAGGFVINPLALNILPDGKSSIEKECFERLCPMDVVYAYKHSGQWFPTDTLEKYRAADKNFVPGDK